MYIKTNNLDFGAAHRMMSSFLYIVPSFISFVNANI